MLIAKTLSVTLADFLGPTSQNIGWPIRIKRLHKCMYELEVEGKDNLKPFVVKFLKAVFNVWS